VGLSPPWVCPPAQWAMPPAELGATGGSRGLATPQAQLVRGCPPEAGAAPPLPAAPGLGEGLWPLSQTTATILRATSAASTEQGEGLHGQHGHGGRAMLWRGGDQGWGNLAVPTAPWTPACHLWPGPSCQPKAGWGPLAGGRHQDIGRLLAFLPPTPSVRYPTLGSPWGYLTPSLGSGFLRAGGRSAASHIPKETVGSFEKVGLALGCLFIAPRTRHSHASVPQRSCTGLFIFPLLCFPLGRPFQECCLVWQTWGSRGGFRMSQWHHEGCRRVGAPARPRLGALPGWEGHAS